mmetsp:Transcript_7812/g.6979  ORF Transcript_7812/g.6979 Transcript_7812/m.6979 type:complete len:175 (+) Transcript_7812:24-548(+)
MTSNQQNQQVNEVSESAFEYLLGEILSSKHFKNSNDNSLTNDNEFIILQRLDDMGYNVGYKLIEKLAAQHRYLGSEPLDIVKFLCKEFWEHIFKKKIDKLQTNHKGVFVLSDFKFKWLERYSSDDIASKQAAVKMLHFPCGLIRGALNNLGLNAVVNAEFNNFPGCIFNVRLKN